MILQEKLLPGLPIGSRRGLVRFPRFGFLGTQKSQAGQLLTQMIGFGGGNGRLPAQLKVTLVDNGRYLAPHQPIFAQKEAFVGENVELEQLVVAGGGAVGVEGGGQNGR